MKKKTVLLSGLRSDSHTWGLAYLKLWLEERDFVVINLGSCVPPEEVAAACRQQLPALVVLSSVNGHGVVEGVEVMEELRRGGCRPKGPVVIGGKLTTSVDADYEATERLLAAGFSGVFTGSSAMADFNSFLLQSGLIPMMMPIFEVASA